jgi:prepilin-type processing-associated H-X9-DG protein
MIPIMPYMEQQPLFNIYTNFGGLDYSGPRYNGGVNANVANKALKTFSCPSDMPQKWGSWTKHNYALNAGNTSLYQVGIPMNMSTLSPQPAGCSGSTVTPGCTVFGGAPFNFYSNDLQTLQAGGDSTQPYTAPTPQHPNIQSGNLGRPVKMTSIIDGTSNTIMGSEIIQGRSNDLRGFTWWGGSSGFTTQMGPNSPLADVLTGGICNNGQNPWMKCTGTSTVTRPRMIAARSFHTNGVNVSLCDGSVRFVPNSINQSVWMAASTSMGGETLGNGW